MKKYNLSTPLLILTLIFNVPSTRAQDTLQFPIPVGNPNQLFFLQRTQNINTVIYELNIKNGVMDTLNPVHIFWICYAEKSQKEELTEIQRKHAYGLLARYISKDHYELMFLAYKKYTLDLKKGLDNAFHVYAKINQKQTILSRIYIQIHGGTLLSPNIEYVMLTGTDPESGTEVTEKKKI